jgi:hypothetical protein
MKTQWRTIVLMTPTIFLIVYWVFGSILFSLNFIPAFKKFKIQPEKGIDMKKCLKVRGIEMNVVLKVVNHLVSYISGIMGNFLEPNPHRLLVCCLRRCFG